MKIITQLCLSLFLLAGFATQAQEKAERPSPPRAVTQDVNGGKVSITYSSPAVKDRKIWGELVPYGKVWRTGANEATTITFEKDVKINGYDIPAGKYALFTIPGEKEWTIIINSVWDQWGAYNYDSSKDVLRFNVASKSHKEMQERMEFEISPKGEVDLIWEHVKVSFKVD